MRPRIAIVNSATFGAYTGAFERLSALGEVERLSLPRELKGRELATRLSGFQIIVASTNPKYDEEFFRSNKDVVLLARNGIGLDNIDLKAATENGVIVTRVPGEVEREAVAELAVALMLDALRSVSAACLAVRDGKWRERGRFIGLELKGKTVGIIGLGNIGGRVAEILTAGFQARVIAYDPYVTVDEAERLCVKLTDLETLLRESDIISLHAPLTDQTYHIINSKAISIMKDKVILVNTARGGLVDTNALLEALESGKLLYAALDVIEGDYVGPEHPLLRHENIVITPHIGAYTYESFKGIDECVVESIEAVVKGMRPKNVANIEVFERRVRALA
ncbi:MAG: D-isomer specific 2-hydroxyacid dehydrogenase family protein [Nitrososphaerota archaeon]|nr:D-isomer specific 2-hydroxyacid dehydrogenase family protein [Candidatus Calditenuaceae archaeon]MDW8073107.1 D-isomer specific 2-hydroxyacid dehydrogenase family protein [Nitrososphaerota archaeon]